MHEIALAVSAWVRSRWHGDERGAAVVLEALAVSVVGILLLLAFLPPARTLVNDIVTWVRTNTIGSS